MALESAQRLSGLFTSLLTAAERYFHGLGLHDLRRTEGDRADTQGLELEDVTAFVQVLGSIQGGFLLSVDYHLSRQLAKHFMLGEINDVEAGQFAVEVVAEVANIVTAHSVSDRETQDLLLGNPLVVLSREMAVCAGTYQSQLYRSGEGKLRLIFIPKMDKTELASIVAIRKETT